MTYYKAIMPEKLIRASEANVSESSQAVKTWIFRITPYGWQ